MTPYTFCLGAVITATCVLFYLVKGLTMAIHAVAALGYESCRAVCQGLGNVMGVVLQTTWDMLLYSAKGLVVAIPTVATLGFDSVRIGCHILGIVLGVVLPTTWDMLLNFVKGLTLAIPTLFKGLVWLGKAAAVQVVVQAVVHAAGQDVAKAVSPLSLLVLLGQTAAPVVRAVGAVALPWVDKLRQIGTGSPTLRAALSITRKCSTMSISHLLSYLVDTPLMWEACTEGCIEVTRYSAEWHHIADYFKASLATTLGIMDLNIERVQSKSLWQSYAVKRQEVEHRFAHYPEELVNNKGRPEERWLFHGTTMTAVPQIVKHGFNRSFAGHNGATYGKGSYFARDASYSCRYAVPDSSGIQHVFMCRMVVGDWCSGSQDQLTPNSKPGGGMYDSTVDNIANPKVFVAYHDAQVYPEYLVSFQL
jgi:Poly(ADP-ribose) polymerase catalytic domain